MALRGSNSVDNYKIFPSGIALLHQTVTKYLISKHIYLEILCEQYSVKVFAPLTKEAGVGQGGGQGQAGQAGCLAGQGDRAGDRPEGEVLDIDGLLVIV